MPKLRDALPTLEFFADIYRQNSNPNDAYYSICQRYAHFTYKLVQIGHIGFLSSPIMAALLGCYQCWQSHGQSQIHHVYFPGIRADESMYLIGSLTVVNIVLTVLIALCIAPPDILFFLTFGNVPVVPAILRQIVDEVNVWLRQHRPIDRSTADVVFIKRRFLQFVAIHQKYNE